MTVQDWLGQDNKLGIDIWTKKYQKNNENFEEWLDRVSNGNKAIRKLILEKKFLPGGRIMSNIGIKGNSTLSNCYSRGYVEDDYSDILKAAVDIGKTFKAEGGQGLSLTKIRPKDTFIGENNQFVTDGIIPFMKLYNEVTEATTQGGSRKGALMISLDAWHKEAMNFITIKSENGIIEKANISLEIDDEFMEAVERYYSTGEVVTVHKSQDYSGHLVEWDVIPIEVYKAMIHNNYDWGDPGVLFVDRLRNYNIMEFDDEYAIETVNPCGEQPLPKHGACCLSSINLAEFVDNPFTDEATFDFDRFRDAVVSGIEYLDTIVDLNAYRHPLPEQQKVALDYRNVGLGVFGYGSALMKLGIKYGSGKAKTFTNNLFNLMFRQAVEASSDIAEVYGSFPKYTDKVWESKIMRTHFSEREINELKKKGLRNCSLLSIAPTGSLSTMLGETGGCEPEYAISYTRRTVGLTDNQDHYYKVYCKTAREYVEMTGDEDLPEYFIGSADIDPLDRVQTQAIMQNHIDTGISSTINLPESATEEQMEEIYLEAWLQGLKGLTIFRDNCKKLGILTTTTPTESESTVTENVHYWGDIVKNEHPTLGLTRKLTTGCGSLFVTANFDRTDGRLVETFFSKGSSGGCNSFMVALSRTITLACSYGATIDAIKDQLDSTIVCPSYAVRTATKHDTSKGSSCPMAIGNVLYDMYREMQSILNSDRYSVEVSSEINAHVEDVKETYKEIDGMCPECGAILVHEGGCDVCKECGWSHCN